MMNFVETPLMTILYVNAYSIDTLAIPHGIKEII